MPGFTRCSLIVLILLCLTTPAVSAEEPQYAILVLHSYNIDYQWTQDQHTAFTETLESAGINGTYSIEFLDAKKFSGAVSSRLAADSFLSKYGQRQYDLIYTTDDDAFSFLMELKPAAFPDVPVIAGGINRGTDISGLSEDFHVILEQANFKRTLELIILTQPDVRRIHIVNDRSTTGKIFKDHILRDISPLFPQLTFVWVESLSLSKFPAYFSSLDPATEGIMLNIYFTDGNSETYTDREAARVIVRHAPVPVWCNWNFHLGTGVIGGNLVSGVTQGRQAGELARDLLLDRALLSPTYDTILLNQTVIDYTALQRYQLEDFKFPDDALIINKPVSYLEQNKQLMISLGSVIIILLLIIALLSRLNRDQKLIQLKNEELLIMKTAVIRNQKEIVFRMGELIENRSHDTGNHVRRVALISRALGIRIGLSEDAVQELEIASPMHDVGKIGIPEDILNKPGKLTAEEREVMNTHTTLGHRIFCSSDLPVFQTAAIVSHQHHEHWDGRGYPLGLMGEEIHIYARIVAIADVFDALLSERVYKKPWPLEDALAFFREKSGLMFDPHLVDIMMEILPELLAIRDQYQDELPQHTDIA